MLHVRMYLLLHAACSHVSTTSRDDFQTLLSVQNEQWSSPCGALQVPIDSRSRVWASFDSKDRTELGPGRQAVTDASW